MNQGQIIVEGIQHVMGGDLYSATSSLCDLVGDS